MFLSDGSIGTVVDHADYVEVVGGCFCKKTKSNFTLNSELNFLSSVLMTHTETSRNKIISTEGKFLVIAEQNRL